MDGGYKGWNPYIEKHLAILSIVFALERTNQLSLLPDKDLVDLCPPIEPYQVTKNPFSLIKDFKLPIPTSRIDLFNPDFCLFLLPLDFLVIPLRFNFSVAMRLLQRTISTAT